eukprot:4960049-Amphidinium_carterae.1
MLLPWSQRVVSLQELFCMGNLPGWGRSTAGNLDAALHAVFHREGGPRLVLWLVVVAGRGAG